MTEETEVGHLEEASYAAEYKKQATWIARQRNPRLTGCTAPLVEEQVGSLGYRKSVADGSQSV